MLRQKNYANILPFALKQHSNNLDTNMTQQMPNLLKSYDLEKPWKYDVLFLILILGALFFILLGSRPLFVPDEGRYAEIAREMVVSRDYITPYLNHIEYFEKPILFYWLETAAIKLAGLHIWTLRSINAVLGLLGALFTYGFARTLYGRLAGFLSALILSTCGLYFIMAHMITLDLPVTVFLSTCLYGFLLGTQAKPGRKKLFLLWGASISAALAVLTKGLIGIVFPIMIIGSWIMILGEWRLLKQLHLPSCLFLFFLITIPWHVIINNRHPEFFNFYFINQHFLRYTHSHIGHYQPGWFFIPCLALGMFPWIFFLPQALIMPFKEKIGKIDGSALFLLLWAAIIFIFFSFSKSKLIPYILPAIPPLAVLIARYLQKNIELQKSGTIKTVGKFLFLFSFPMTAAFYIFLNQTVLPHPIQAKFLFYTACLIWASGTLCSYFFLAHSLTKGILILTATTGLFLLSLYAAIPAIDNRSILPLAEQIKSSLTQKNEVITYNKYFQDLPFYLKRRVSILNWKNELTYGMKYQDTHEWMINDATFWQHWHGDKRVFVLIGLNDYAELRQTKPSEKIFFLGKTLNTALISNSPP